MLQQLRMATVSFLCVVVGGGAWILIATGVASLASKGGSAANHQAGDATGTPVECLPLDHTGRLPGDRDRMAPLQSGTSPTPPEIRPPMIVPGGPVVIDDRFPELTIPDTPWPTSRTPEDLLLASDGSSGSDAERTGVVLMTYELAGEMVPVTFRFQRDPEPEFRLEIPVMTNQSRPLQVTVGGCSILVLAHEDIAAETSSIQIDMEVPVGCWVLALEPPKGHPTPPMIRRVEITRWGSGVRLGNERVVPYRPSRTGVNGNPVPPRLDPSPNLRVRVQSKGSLAPLTIRRAVLLPPDRGYLKPLDTGRNPLQPMMAASRHYIDGSGASLAAPVGQQPAEVQFFDVPRGAWELWLQVDGARLALSSRLVYVRGIEEELVVEMEPGASVRVEMPDTPLPIETTLGWYASGGHFHRGLRSFVVHGVADGTFVWRGWVRIGDVSYRIQSEPVEVRNGVAAGPARVPPLVWLTVRATLRGPNEDDRREAASAGVAFSPIELQKMELRLPIDEASYFVARRTLSDPRVTLSFLTQAGRVFSYGPGVPESTPLEFGTTEPAESEVLVVPPPDEAGRALVNLGVLRVTLLEDVPDETVQPE